MSDVHIRAPFQSGFPDEAQRPSPHGPRPQPSDWNASRLLSGGNDGETIERHSASPTGAIWVPKVVGDAVKRTILDHAAILGLNTVMPSVVLAQGPGTIVDLIAIAIHADTQAGAYFQADSHGDPIGVTNGTALSVLPNRWAEINVSLAPNNRPIMSSIGATQGNSVFGATLLDAADLSFGTAGYVYGLVVAPEAYYVDEPLVLGISNPNYSSIGVTGDLFLGGGHPDNTLTIDVTYRVYTL